MKPIFYIALFGLLAACSVVSQIDPFIVNSEQIFSDIGLTSNPSSFTNNVVSTGLLKGEKFDFNTASILKSFIPF